MIDPSPFGALSTISQFDGNEAVAAAMCSTRGGPSAGTTGGGDGGSDGAGDALAAMTGSAGDSEPLDGAGLDDEAIVLEDAAVSVRVDDAVLAHATRLDAASSVSERIEGIVGMRAQSLTRVARVSNTDYVSWRAGYGHAATRG